MRKRIEVWVEEGAGEVSVVIGSSEVKLSMTEAVLLRDTLNNAFAYDLIRGVIGG